MGRVPNGPAMPRRNRPSAKERPCPEGAKQVSPGQSEAAQPPSAALGKRPTRTSVALKGQNKCAINAPQTHEIVRRNDLNAAIKRNAAESLIFFLPVEARESRPSNHIRFSVLSCPFGA